ncbi:MAG: hypothetical protein ACKOEX_08615 [Planctomycetia bacterium]
MSSARRKRVPRASVSDVGVFQPDQFWGRPLSERYIPDAHLPFEEQVERALRHIEATRFTEDEHERLREALVEVIEDDRRGVMPAKGGET